MRRSGFCSNGVSHAHCRQSFPRYGASEPWTCECTCHELPGLVRRIGPETAVLLLKDWIDQGAAS